MIWFKKRLHSTTRTCVQKYPTEFNLNRLCQYRFAFRVDRNQKKALAAHKLAVAKANTGGLKALFCVHTNLGSLFDNTAA